MILTELDILTELRMFHCDTAVSARTEIARQSDKIRSKRGAGGNVQI